MQERPISERAPVGPVREDYSESGGAWNYFTHDQARSPPYRWGDDGIAGTCDERPTAVPGSDRVEWC